VGGRDEQHVHATRDELLYGLALNFRILLGRSDNERISAVTQRESDGTDDFGEKRVNQIRDDEPDHVGAAGDERTSSQIWAVIQFLNALEYARLGLLTDVGVIAKCFGDRDYAYTEVPSDVFKSDTHRR